MKRKIVTFLLCFVFLIPIRVQAADFRDIQYVVDTADILTSGEKSMLNSLAAAHSEAYGVDILIAVTQTMYGESAESYAVSLNDDGGIWESEDAILFLLSMEEREWYIATFGEAISIFTDYGLDRLGETAVAYFRDGRYYDGFEAYLDQIPSFFSGTESSPPIQGFIQEPGQLREPEFTEPARDRSFLNVLPVSLLIGIIAAGISLFAMRSAMNTKRRQRSAVDYLNQGSYHLRTHQDIFLYSNLSKTPRQQNTGGHSGGHSGPSGGGHGGRSHGGRGGRF